jgi:hypothetical protein
VIGIRSTEAKKKHNFFCLNNYHIQQSEHQNLLPVKEKKQFDLTHGDWV